MRCESFKMKRFLVVDFMIKGKGVEENYLVGVLSGLIKEEGLGNKQFQPSKHSRGSLLCWQQFEDHNFLRASSSILSRMPAVFLSMMAIRAYNTRIYLMNKLDPVDSF